MQNIVHLSFVFRKTALRLISKMPYTHIGLYAERRGSSYTTPAGQGGGGQGLIDGHNNGKRGEEKCLRNSSLVE